MTDDAIAKLQVTKNLVKQREMVKNVITQSLASAS